MAEAVLLGYTGPHGPRWVKVSLAVGRDVIGGATLYYEEARAGVTIYAVRIDEPYRGMGHGRRLMELILEKTVGMPATLYVQADNLIAKHLYESCGFVLERFEEHTNRLWYRRQG